MSQVIPAELKGYDFESIEMDGSPHALDTVKLEKAKAVIIQFQGDDGYYRMDAAPTNEEGGGLLAEDGQEVFFDRFNLENLQVISGSGHLVVQFLS